jgi:hypothetical protein
MCHVPACSFVTLPLKNEKIKIQYNYFSAEINEKSRKGFQGPGKHLFKKLKER